jgi:hypothetical protein
MPPIVEKNRGPTANRLRISWSSVGLLRGAIHTRQPKALVPASSMLGFIRPALDVTLPPPESSLAAVYGNADHH